MLTVVVKSSLDLLLDALADCRRIETAKAPSPFAPTAPIVISGPALGQWVRRGLAARCGVASGLDLMQLRRFLERRIVGDGAIVLLDKERFEAALVRVFEAESAAPELVAARRYIGATESTRGMAKRRVQLAARLARLFEEYVLSRPEWLEAWSAGELIGLGGFEALEAAAWRAVRARLEKALATKGRRVVTLAEWTKDESLTVAAPTELVHVFAPATMAVGYHEALLKIARTADVRLYLQDDAADFAEGAPTAASLLRYARTQREYLAMVGGGAVKTTDHGSKSVLPPGSTHLDAVKQALRSGGLPATPGAFDVGDRTFRVVRAPSERREIEIAATAVWNAVAEERAGRRPLRFDEIAILIAGGDVETYEAHIAAVFEEQNSLPFRLPSRGGRGRSLFVDAAEALLGLPRSRFGRGDVLPVLESDAFRARRPEWARVPFGAWCRELGILYGIDRSDHAGTYLERDRFNWDQGIRRLELGLLAGRFAGGLPYRVGDDDYAPALPADADCGSVAAFVLLVRSLTEDARRLGGDDDRRPLAGWIDAMASLVRRYLAAPDGEEESARDFHATLEALCLGDLDGTPIPYDEAFERVAARLASESGGAPALSGGVVVGALGDVRRIPFRMTVIVGLSQARFPGSDEADIFDLRAAAPRRPGDVSRSDLGLAAFHDACLATGERLVLSYVDREATSGDELEPSSVIDDLFEVQRVATGRDDAPSRFAEIHPLRRFDPVYFGDDRALGRVTSPGASLERTAALWRRELETVGARPRTAAELEPWLDASSKARLVEVLPAWPIAAEANEERKRVRAGVSQIARFLLDPLEAELAFHLGLEEDEEPELEDHEPFDVDALMRAQTLREALARVGGGASPPDAYCHAAAQAVAAGVWPDGLFGDGVAARHRSILSKWLESFEELGLEPRAVRTYSIGKPPHSGRASMALPLLYVQEAAVENGGRSIAIHGHIPFVDAEKGFVLQPKASSVGDESIIRGFVEWVVLVAADVAFPAESTVAAIGGDGKATVKRFKTPSREEASRYLASLVAALTARTRAYRLPFGAVEAIREGAPIEHAVLAAEDAGASSGRKKARPDLVRRRDRYPFPSHEEAERAIVERFDFYFASMIEAPKA